MNLRSIVFNKERVYLEGQIYITVKTEENLRMKLIQVCFKYIAIMGFQLKLIPSLSVGRFPRYLVKIVSRCQLKRLTTFDSGESSANNAIVYCLINDINGSRPLKNIFHIFLHCIGVLHEVT